MKGKLAVLLLLSIGVVSFGVGFFLLLNRSNTLEKGVEVGAVIVGFEERSISRRVYRYPQVQFALQSGDLQTAQLKAATTSEQYAIGDSLIVVYDPSYPELVLIKGAAQTYLLPALLIGLGFLTVLSSLFLFRRPH
jgi:hypothetical protein